MASNRLCARHHEQGGSVTYTFGSILKIDSTKKMIKKLAGQVLSTTSWVTNVGNKHGAVLMSVLTASEGVGLTEMANGLIDQYFANRDCCGGSGCKLQALFHLYPDLIV